MTSADFQQRYSRQLASEGVKRTIRERGVPDYIEEAITKTLPAKAEKLDLDPKIAARTAERVLGAYRGMPITEDNIPHALAGILYYTAKKGQIQEGQTLSQRGVGIVFGCDRSTVHRWDNKYGQYSNDCFISTACFKAMRLPDNCLELKVLRKFRDNYVRGLPNGKKLIAEYNTIAPQVVKAVNGNRNSKEIYSKLYNAISKAVKLILVGRNEEALKIYITVAQKLKSKFLAS